MRLVPSISQIAGAAVVVLPEDVGLAVAVEVAGAVRHASSAPDWTADHWRPATRVSAVHQPDRRRAVVVLPQDVGLAVAVEVAAA